MSKSATVGSKLVMQSSWGSIEVYAQGGKLVSCSLPQLTAEPHKSFRWLKSSIHRESAADDAVLKKARTFIHAVFKGSAHRPPPFEWPRATPFTLRVWRTLLAIPRGKVMEYGQLAARIGRPGGARAVGRACGANPLPLIIPCHRVLASDRTLGGFSCGLPWKRLLLERERALTG